MTGQAHAAYGPAIGAIAEVGTFVFNQAPGRREPSADATPLGASLAEVTDPFVLEVHRPITLDGAGALPPLPQYVRRDHDARLAGIVARAAAGESAMAVLVAGSSAGKTRACWEALEPLRGAEGWRLWHPYDPTRSEAAVAALDRVGPRTVVWLNETQEYLGSGDEAERVAAKLRSLLSDSTRAPVLVLGTLWPEHHAALTQRPGSQVRLVLEGTVIEVPEAFTGAALAAVRQATAVDERLKRAVEHADDGQITQYLAGGPELLERFHAAPPAAKALVLAAMDARRLGHRSGLPLALLEQAAPAYLTDAQLDRLGEDWLEEALAYASRPGKGARGPIARIRPGRGPRSRARAQPSDLRYQLADYLDQYGRALRSEQIPPVGFWVAAASHAHPDSLDVLADAAWKHGLLRDAAQLGKNAIGHGATRSASALVRRMRIVHPADLSAAGWAVEHLALDDASDVAQLLEQLQTAETTAQRTALLERDPAGQVGLGNSYGISQLLEQLHLAGASTQVAKLADRAAHEAVLDNSYGVGQLLEQLQAMGTPAQVAALADRAVSRVVLENASALTGLFQQLLTVAAADQVAALLARDPARHVALDHPSVLAQLLEQLRELGAADQVAVLLARDPARHVGLDRPASVAKLLHQLQAVGAGDQVRALAARAAAEVALGNPDLAQLLEQLREVGATDQLAALLARDPAGHVALDGPSGVSPFGVGDLLNQLRTVGADDQVAKLAGRAVAEMALDTSRGVSHLFDQVQAAGNADQLARLADRAAAEMTLDRPYAIAQLLGQLRTGGFSHQVAALLTRDPASRVALDSPSGIAELLDQLRAAGASEQVARLAGRAASEVALDYPFTIAQLLERLRTVGAVEEAAALAGRAAAHVALDSPFGLGQLLEQLRAVGAGDQVAALLARDPAAHATLDNPFNVASLLEQLHAANADDQVAALLARDPAAKVTLDSSFGITALLKQLQALGATEQLAVLLAREPAAIAASRTTGGNLYEAGPFEHFLTIGDHAVRFRFGREPDGSPADAWSWDDLE